MVKIFQLSRELNITSKKLIDQAKGLGIKVKNHMSSINDADAFILIQAYEKTEGVVDSILLSARNKLKLNDEIGKEIFVNSDERLNAEINESSAYCEGYNKTENLEKIEKHKSESIEDEREMKIDQKSCMKAILKTNNFSSALQYKLLLESEGLNANEDIYYELIYRCDDSENVLKLKAEMDRVVRKIKERTYILIYKKIDAVNRVNLLKEIESKGIRTSIKMYYVMIRKAETLDMAISFFEKMKSQGLKPDLPIYIELIKRARGIEQYSWISKEKERFEQLGDILNNIENFNDAEIAVKRTREANIFYDIELYNDLILLIKSDIDRIQLLDLIKRDGIQYNHYTYWNFQKKVVQEKSLCRNRELLKEIQNELDVSERKQLLDLYRINSKEIGGWTNILVAEAKVIKEIEQQINNCIDFKEELFLVGFRDGMETRSKHFKNEIKRSYDELQIIEMDNFENMLDLNISYIRGSIEGMKRKQNIVADIRAKKIPILVVCFCENPDILERFKLIALKNSFYQYGIEDINNLSINGFIFADRFTDFEDLISQIDFEKYEVAINILAQDSQKFEEEFGDEIIIKLNSMRGSRFSHLRFMGFKEYIDRPNFEIRSSKWKDMFSDVVF